MSSATLRRIEPMHIPDLKPSTVKGKRPELRWVKPTSLWVDETYQRDLSRKSVRLIRQLIEHFAWNRMKPPIVVEADEGLHVVDGQHTAIAAASVGVKEIPVFVVEAKSLDERARAFVGHNSDRIVVSPIQIYRALLAAGDPDTKDIENVCKRAGIRIRTMNQLSSIAEGDTMAVGTIRTLINRRGVVGARKALEALVKARRAPVTAAEMLAADHVLSVAKNGIAPDVLAKVVRIGGDLAIAEAHAQARSTRSPVWRCLADRWLADLGRRGAAA